MLAPGSLLLCPLLPGFLDLIEVQSSVVGVLLGSRGSEGTATAVLAPAFPGRGYGEGNYSIFQKLK